MVSGPSGFGGRLDGAMSKLDRRCDDGAPAVKKVVCAAFGPAQQKKMKTTDDVDDGRCGGR